MEYTLSILVASLLSHSLCFAEQETLYVTPSEEGNNCPPNFPCFTLMNYIEMNDFTSNRNFIFLEGNHEFDRVLSSTGATGLTLHGINSGVLIDCVSPDARIEISDFSQLIIDNLVISGECGSPVLTLSGGTTAHFGHLNISVTATILNAFEVTGFSILDSYFFVASLYFDVPPILITLANCNGNDVFLYNNNTLLADSIDIVFELQLNCNVNAEIENSTFENSLIVKICTPQMGTLHISRSIFTNSHTKFFFCSESALTVITLEELHMQNSQLTVENTTNTTSVSIQNSTFFEFSNAREAVINITQYSIGANVVLTNVTFTNNTASSQNYLKNAVISCKNCTFNYNSGTAIQAINSEVFIKNNCRIENNTGSAIEAQNSKILFQGNSTFRNNSNTLGGAIQLLSQSYMYLQEDASILFVDNHADYLGGAIYIDRKEKHGCFFQSNSSSPDTFEVTFVNNTASYSGAAMYGNSISFCCEDPSCSNFLRQFNFSKNPFAIGSDPSKVCFCDAVKSQPDCTRANHSIQVFPGQDFSIYLAVVGSVYDVAVPGFVQAFNYNKSVLPTSQTLQNSDKAGCASMQYTVNSTEKSERFSLTIEQAFIATITDDKPSSLFLDVIVLLKDCPQGFIFSNESKGCECLPEIKKYSVLCNINNQSFLLPPNSWMGFNESCTGENCVAFNSKCPIGYCSPEPAYTSSTSPDMICSSNKTGALCGECKEGYSLALGNQVCRECSDYWLLLMIPIMALAGLFLVFILFFLNLTVTEGTINGLLFYANIVGLYHRELLVLAAYLRKPENKAMLEVGSSYLYIVLAWINLDFGIDNTCFHYGMDHYEETWLQFIFPVYLWIIILVIILLYKKFPRFAAKYGGGNTVSVLATLLLMSFTKLIRTAPTILASTHLDSREVWLYDASHDFFKGDHFYLGIAGLLVIVFLIIPYVICMTFFQQFQACSGHKPFKWVNRLMPVYDAYASPYKDQYRFWTGFLLLIRVGLLILYNCTQSLEVTLTITAAISFALAMINSNGIYKKWPCNILESFYYCQLGFFATIFAYLKNPAITVLSNISFGLSIIVFFGIVGYHGYVRIKKCCHFKGYERIDQGNEGVIVSTRPTPIPTPSPSHSPSPSPCPSPDTY